MAKWVAWLLSFFIISNIGHAQEMSVTQRAKRYVGADLYLSQTLGTGAISKNLSSDNSFSSGLTIYPTLKSEKFWGDRSIKAFLEFNTSYEWNQEAASTNRLDFTDVKLRVQLKNALSAKSIGINFTPGLKIEIPTSHASNVVNRLVGIGSNMSLTWEKWGLSLSYKPTFISYIHTSPFKSTSCSPDAPAGDNLGNGQCRVDGRQTMLMLKNGLFASYSLGEHSITGGMRAYHGFLRAPSAQSGDNPVGQTYTEATLGILEYAYSLPVKMPVALSFGITSYNGSYDPNSGFRVPFFSSNPLASNFSSLYFAVDLTI